MTEKQLVSTIIPVYNRSELLKEAVQSVLDQKYRPIEIIIIDDGSTDNTPETVDSLAEKYPHEIKVFHISNSGPGLARETGRKIARGDFIQYLDSDDRLLPEKFEVQVNALLKHQECGIAYGITRLIDNNGDVLKSPYKWTGKKFDTLFPALLVDRWWNTHTPLFRRSVCDAVGPWRDMRMSEDWEYEARVGALGIKLIHCSRILSDTRYHNTARLTGGKINTEKLLDISKLILTLYECAKKADIPISSSEMRHFSRWAFLVSRQAGAIGLCSRAEQCFSVARIAAGTDRGRGLDFRLSITLAKIIGWKWTCRLLVFLTRIRGGNAGEYTIKQSWMEDSF